MSRTSPDFHPGKLIFSIAFSLLVNFLCWSSLNELLINITLRLALNRCLNCDYYFFFFFFLRTCESGISVGVERIKVVFLTAEMINGKLLRVHLCFHSVGIIMFTEMTVYEVSEIQKP